MALFFRYRRLCRGLLWLLAALKVTGAAAQHDSISLKEVTVRGIVPLRYMAGLHVEPLDSAVLNQFAFRRLEELLAQSSPLVFRNYGNGQLSTIAFRGLSSNHTAVLWNGVNINLPTLGQTDFSTVPVASFDRLSVQYGAGASNLGTDAVGGSIVMESAPMTVDGVSVRGGLEYGSFSNWSAQAGARYRYRISPDWALAGRTQFYSGNYYNDYPYTSFKGRRVEHSTTFQDGFLQDIFFEKKDGKTFSAHFWLSDHQMTLWPDRPYARELTGMNNLRAMIRYGDGKWQLRGSFIRDIIDYAVGDYSALDRSRTDRYGMKADREMKWSLGRSALSVLAGAEYTLFKALVNGYGTPHVAESRGDIFILTRLGHPSGWAASVNMRQAFVEGYTVPFTPSAGFEYALAQKEPYRLKANIAIARSYRVPTLNERYWKDLGNPGIRPESGFNKEAGLVQEIAFLSFFNVKTRVSVFHNKVDDWVYWNPARNYRAENLQMVLSRGAELHNRFTYARGKWSAGLETIAGYTRSTQEKAYDQYSADVLGKQLRFVPVWVSNWNAFARYGNSALTLQLHSESVRYSTFDHSQYLPSYRLVNIVCEQAIRIGEVAAHLQGRIANLTDQLYLNVKSGAMPGRSFHISMLINYSLLQSKP